MGFTVFTTDGIDTTDVIQVTHELVVGDGGRVLFGDGIQQFTRQFIMVETNVIAQQ